MSTFFNNAVFLDYSTMPYTCTFQNLANYYMSSVVNFTDQGQVQYTPVNISDSYYQIINGSMFFLTKSSKFVVLPAQPTLGQTIILLDTSNSSAHTVTTGNNSTIQNNPTLSILPNQAVSLVWTQNQWQIVSLFTSTKLV